jgi:hypothetical protein
MRVTFVVSPLRGGLMLSAPFAYVVAGTMLGVCALVALTLIKVVESFDAHDRGTESKPQERADAA